MQFQIKGKKLEDLNILVTGGAGVIGNSLVKRIPGKITVLDNLSSSDISSIEELINEKKIEFIKGDVENFEVVNGAVKGKDLIFHLAANGDVRYDESKPTDLDLKSNTIGTYNIVEAMRKNDVQTVIFASSSSVYGYAEQIPTPETYGPLIPESLYAASKLAAEGLISAFSKMFGFNAFIYRLANIVAPTYRKIGRNVIPDFVFKLIKNQSNLEILGNGKQEKSYLYVDDCIDGMIYLSDRSPKDVDIFNLGNTDSISVDEIAKIIAEEMGLNGVNFNHTGGERGWKGDVPKTILDISKALSLGWKPRLNSAEAVRKSAKEIIRSIKK
ncbi:MAG: NAD-dependent epimerase/dehydratase family protein [Nitrososphaeria archaeon]